MAYDEGNWTKSTHETLKFVEQENAKGIKPKLRDFTSNTYKNWIYVLKKAGYVSNGDGFTITDKGRELLRQLNENPPQNLRGKRKNIDNITKVNNKSNDNKNYSIIIKGKGLSFEESIKDFNDVIKIMNLISELKK